MENFNKVTFQNRLTAFLDENFSNEEARLRLSSAINVSRATIDRWRNQSLIPKIESIANLAIYLKLSIDNIISNKDNLKTFNVTRFDAKSFKQRLSQVIHECQSSYQVGKALNISHTTILLWKKQQSTPSLIKLIQFSKITNYSLDYIILGI